MSDGAPRILLELAASGAWSDLLHKIRRRIDTAAPLPANLAPLIPARGRPRASASPDGRRILMFGPSFRRDGAPKSQFELAAGLAARGWAVKAVAPGAGPLETDYRAAGVDFAYWRELEPEANILGRYEASVDRLAEAIDAHGPDAVYVNTLDAFGAIDAASRLGLPSLWNIREGEDWRFRLNDRTPSIAARALGCFAAAGAVVFVSDATRSAWSRFSPAPRAHVIYNAPRSPRGAPARRAPTTPTLVAIGTICARKNQAEIVEALGGVDAGRRIRLRVVGRIDPSYAARWAKALEGPGGERVESVGEVDDVGEILAEATALVHAATAEAFPRVFFEAAVAGAPIVATRAGGIEERLKHGVSALLYDVGDVAALRGHIERITSDPALGRELAAAARASLIESWTYEDMLGAYERVLCELVLGPRDG